MAEDRQSVFTSLLMENVEIIQKSRNDEMVRTRKWYVEQRRQRERKEAERWATEEAWRRRVRAEARAQIAMERRLREQAEFADSLVRVKVNEYRAYEKQLSIAEIDIKSKCIDFPRAEAFFVNAAKLRGVDAEGVDDIFEHMRKEEQDRILSQIYEDLTGNPFLPRAESQVRLVFQNPRSFDTWSEIPDVASVLDQMRQKKAVRDAREFPNKLLTKLVTETMPNLQHQVTQGLAVFYQTQIAHLQANQRSPQRTLQYGKGLKQALGQRNNDQDAIARTIAEINRALRAGELNNARARYNIINK